MCVCTCVHTCVHVCVCVCEHAGICVCACNQTEVITSKKTQKITQNAFLIRQNKTECNFLSESSSSKPQTIPRQPNNLAAASWILPDGCVHFVLFCLVFCLVLSD